MISMIWISQSALRFADTDLFATIFFGVVLMWIVMSFRSDEEGAVISLFQNLITGLLCIFARTSIWNNNTQCQDEKKAMNPKKEKKKKKETPPPVLVDDKKKKNRKNKRSQRKIVSKENKESTIVKERTKMYQSLETCKKLNRSSRSIYDELLKFILTPAQMAMNNFPSLNYRPPNLVDADNYSRVCVRCSEKFDIYKGVYLSATTCSHHPRKATFCKESGERIYSCCNRPFGSDPCTVSNYHVTHQHGPRSMTRTTSRRHIKNDEMYRIFSLDCEMSYTTDGLEVTRIGLVDLDGTTVYDSYVKPKNKILDYNTLYSGVEKRHLENVQITIDDVKKILGKFIHEDTILIGHALNNDLAALGLIHYGVVDTSVMYKDPTNPTMKKSLKYLASQHLGISIQDEKSGHDCIEDARASLQLALLKVPPQFCQFIGSKSSNMVEYFQKIQGVNENLSPVKERRLPTNGSKRQEQQQPFAEIQNVCACANPEPIQHFEQQESWNGYTSADYNCYDPLVPSTNAWPKPFYYDSNVTYNMPLYL